MFGWEPRGKGESRKGVFLDSRNLFAFGTRTDGVTRSPFAIDYESGCSPLSVENEACFPSTPDEKVRSPVRRGGLSCQNNALLSGVTLVGGGLVGV